MVPDRLWADKRLEPGDVRMWCCLAFLARGRGSCEPTDAILAEKLDVSQQTIRRALLRLERCDYISRERDGQTRIITLKPEGDGQPIAEFTLRVAAG